MKIGIMTWLHNGNYGTVLQAYALQRYLRAEGYDVQSIDFSPTIVEKVKNLIKSKNSMTLFSEKFEAMLTKRKANADKLTIKEKKFDDFLNSQFNLTEPFYKPEALKELSGKYDTYICGSDQIWSPMLLNPAYYFDYLTENDKKIAYACSFAVNQIPDNKKEKIKGYLTAFNKISVRETQGRAIVKDLINEDVPVLVDPTLLLDRDEWDKLASDRIVDKKYVFAYFLTYNQEYFKKAEEIAQQMGCTFVVVPTCKESYGINAEIMQDAGPMDWLSLVANAEAVVTDSFHGCVFSLIYSKQFYVFRRFADSNSKSQNSRVYTLLEEYSLNKCLIEADSPIDKAFIEQDEFLKVTEKISINSDKAKKWLKEAIEDIG